LDKAVSGAWRRPGNNEEIQAWQDLLTNQGYALLMSGDIVHSTDAYTAAFEWARHHREITDESMVLESILKPLGNNYTRLGDYEQALFIHNKALTIAFALGDLAALAGTYSNLANVCSNMGRPGQALDYCRKGLAVTGSHSALSGLLLSEQADAFEQLQQQGAARESILQSIAILEQAGARNADPAAGYWLLTAYQQAGDIYAAQGRSSTTALKLYKHAWALQNRLLQEHGAIRRRERAKLFLRLGALYAHMSQAVQAENWLDQCLGVLIPGKKIDSLEAPDLYGENTLLDLLFVRAGLYEKKQQTDNALRLYALCFATEKKLRRELISSSAKERSVSDSRQRYEEAINTAWNAWERTHEKKYRETILDFMESSKAQLLLEEVQQQEQDFANRDLHDSLQNRIHLLERALVYYRKEALQPTKNDTPDTSYAIQEKQITWELAQLRKKAGMAGPVDASGPVGSIRPVTGPINMTDAPGGMDSLRNLLHKRQVIRSFFAGSKSLYTVEYNSGGIGFAEKMVMEGQWQDNIRAFIHTYFEQGPGHMINQPAAYCSEAYKIYRRLFGAHTLDQGNEYILLPDGALSLLPVEALVTEATCPPNPEKWPYVIRQTLISYGWSMYTMREQLVARGHGGSFSGFFLSGGSQGDQRSSPYLMAADVEKKGMQQIINGGNWYTNERATVSAFKEALQTSAVVHISSHAFAQKDSLNIPRIELFDNAFYLFELKGLEYHPDLVVLGACRTGDGRLVTGEGVQSLARAFTAGGTNAVIASWWNVNDEAAAQMMQGFYSRLASVRDTASVRNNAALALREAKLDWLKDPAVAYLQKLPYYWAALNYLGNPAPLKKGLLHKSNGEGDSWITQAARKRGLFVVLLLAGVVGCLVIWIQFLRLFTKDTN